MPIGIYLFAPFLVAVLVIIVLMIINRNKRKAKMNAEKLKLVEEGKKELSLIINLKRVVPILFIVVLSIINIIIYVQDSKAASTETIGLTEISHVTSNNGITVFTNILKFISYGSIIYTVLYLILIYKIKKTTIFNEEKRIAMLEYYGGRTIYLILTCIVLVVLARVLELILTPAGCTFPY